jgi:hypothetical protein
MTPEEWHHEVLKEIAWVMQPHTYKGALWARIRFYPHSEKTWEGKTEHGRNMVSIAVFSYQESTPTYLCRRKSWWTGDDDEDAVRKLAVLWGVEAGETTLKTFVFWPGDPVYEP